MKPIRQISPAGCGRLLLVSALTLAVGSALAETAGEHGGISKEDMTYEGAPSAVPPGVTKDLMDGEGPQMTKTEF